MRFPAYFASCVHVALLAHDDDLLISTFGKHHSLDGEATKISFIVLFSIFPKHFFFLDFRVMSKCWLRRAPPRWRWRVCWKIFSRGKMHFHVGVGGGPRWMILHHFLFPNFPLSHKSCESMSGMATARDGFTRTGRALLTSKRLR